MFSALLWIAICFSLTQPHTLARPLHLRNAKKPGFSIPITRTKRTFMDSTYGLSGTSGLGDNSDLLYTIPVEFKTAGVTAAFHLDTGSSDTWIITDKCKTGACDKSKAVHYPTASVNASGPSVRLAYGDSTTGTFASGVIAEETMTVAGIAMEGQHFAAIDATTNPVVSYGTSGIFGLGFPAGSQVQQALVNADNDNPGNTDAFINSMSIDGPLLPRISMTDELVAPMFSISLQRNTIDVGGEGLLTVGKLPDGVSNSSITWVPVRLYKPEDGGMAPPTFAPDEVYPYRWEVELDGVFLDGAKVADSTLPLGTGLAPGKISALIDTGNSLLRGPSDVVRNILKTVSPAAAAGTAGTEPTLPCNIPRTIAFSIGGKMFPVDPRDFIGPVSDGDTTTCVADNLVATDRPSRGALFSWSLGDPFLKSNLVVFHYGNLTHPSVDPPRMGFMSLVPDNADQLLTQAVADAKANAGVFESSYAPAPTASAATAAETTLVPSSTAFSSSSSSRIPSPTPTSEAAAAGTQVASTGSQENSAVSSLRWGGVWGVVPLSILSLFCLL